MCKSMLSLAGLLTRFTSYYLPILKDSGIVVKKLFETYSCGDSPGFTPDSLLKLNENESLVTKYNAKVEKEN